MLRARPYTSADRPAWDRYVLAAEGSHPAQLRGWLELTERSSDVHAHAWLVEEAGAVRGVLPLFEKRRLGRAPVLFSAPGGLLAADDACGAALLAVVDDLHARTGAAYVELRDQRHRWPGLATSTEHCTHVLPLAATAEEQWRAFDAKLRNQIRKAQRAGFSVHWGAEHVDAFARVMLENMRDLGTPMRAVGWFRELLGVLGERAALLVLARAGEPVGAMFLALHGGCALDLWASSLRRAFPHCPNQLLYWEAVGEGIRRGLHAFDFGRSQADTGTYRFKQQWGPTLVPLYYQYRLRDADIPRFADQRRRMDLAARLWRRLPLPMARVLGEPIRRRFPELL